MCPKVIQDPVGELPESVVVQVDADGILLIDPSTSFALQLYQWVQVTDYSASDKSFSFEIGGTWCFEFGCVDAEKPWTIPRKH